MLKLTINPAEISPKNQNTLEMALAMFSKPDLNSQELFPTFPTNFPYNYIHKWFEMYMSMWTQNMLFRKNVTLRRILRRKHYTMKVIFTQRYWAKGTFQMYALRRCILYSNIDKVII